MKTAPKTRFAISFILLLSLGLTTTSTSARVPAPAGLATTERVSVASDGTEGNGESGWGQFEDYYQQDISGDGRYVAFFSQATNLVQGDTNGFDDVFVRDWGAPSSFLLPLIWR